MKNILLLVALFCGVGNAAEVVRVVGSPLFTRDYLNNRVGINTMTPQYVLDVNGDSNITGKMNLTGSLTVSTLTVTGNAFSVGGSTLVVSEGKVGVNAVPVNRFSVGTPANTGVNASVGVKQASTADGFLAESSASSRFIKMWHTDSEGKIGVSYNSGATYTPLRFETSDAVQMSILANGNVGIGIDTPVEKLDVVGGIGTYSRTVAQLAAITPGKAGTIYSCSNCSTPYSICVSTGTGTGAFVLLNTTTVCN